MFKKALLFSFAGHLFCFSFFTLDYGIDIRKATDRLTVAFLGAMLQDADFHPPRVSGVKILHGIRYAGERISGADLLKPQNKPRIASANVSFPKRLNKFLVYEERPIPSQPKEKEGYLVSEQAWERVDLKLKIE